jgi:glycosyltransferase involved in cell wall biosynthesis
LRILIANLNRNVVGGAEKYLRDLIPGLQARGHAVALVYECRFDPKAERIDPPASEVPSWCTSELGVAGTLRSIARWEPDIVYSHGLDDGSLESGLLAQYPNVLYAHTYYGTCVTGKKCHATPRAQPCGRKFGAPCLLLYYPRRCGGLNPRTMWQMFRMQSERNGRFAKYAAILVASRHMYDEFERHGVAPDQLRLVRYPLGDDTPAIPPAPRAPGGQILFVGRLVEVKGVHYLIRAMPKAAARLGRPLKLTIAGDGPQRVRLQALASQLQLKIDFTGWVGTEEKLTLMGQADVLAVPSLWPEPFGLVGIEAGRLGLPAVGYAVGGIPDWLISGESGQLAPGDPPSVDGLADAIVKALADGEHYRKLCHGAWRMARQFTLESHIAELQAILAATQNKSFSGQLHGGPGYPEQMRNVESAHPVEYNEP